MAVGGPEARDAAGEEPAAAGEEPAVTGPAGEEPAAAGVPPWSRVVMRVESVPAADGAWVRRVTFPGGPPIRVDHESVVEAIDRAQELLRRWHLERGAT